MEGRVGDGASRLREVAQHGGERCEPQNPLDRTKMKNDWFSSRFSFFAFGIIRDSNPKGLYRVDYREWCE